MSLHLAISPRDRRMLLIGVVSIGSILLAAQGVPAWREWEERSCQADREAQAELRNLETQLRTLSAVRDSLRVRSSRADGVRTRLVTAESVSGAGAALSEIVLGIADELGVRTTSMQVRQDSVFHAGQARIAVRLTAIGDVEHLSNLLKELETSPTLMAVRELSVTPADPFTVANKAETLRFQVLVEGLARQGKRDAANE